MSGLQEPSFEQLAVRAVEYATKRGADEAAATVRKGRSISVQYRDGDLELLREAQSSALSIFLFVDNRYSSHSTCDLRPTTLDGFIDHAIELTRLLGQDPCRRLADPKLYEGRPDDDLEIWDPAYQDLDPERRKALAREAEAVARANEGPIISATGSYTDQQSVMTRVHSNGFSGAQRGTQFWVGAEVSVRDAGERRPEDWHFAGSRRISMLPSPAEVGSQAAKRAVARMGQKKLSSGETRVLVDSRAAGRLVGALVGAMSGAALQQKRSFLLDRLGQRIASPLLTLIDDPLLPGGFGSRHFDSDGISSRRRRLIGEGVLEEYLLDVYYALKLGAEPTGGGTSNLVFSGGEHDVAGLAKEMGSGIYVTGILGGNTDGTTGDFSHGIVGFEVSGGSIKGPVGEMNITGTHADLWDRLIAVGNDPYPYSANRVPSLLFDSVAVSGA